MSVRVNHMQYGANLGLSRNHCRRCGEETLHRYAKCVHCGTVYEVVIPQNLSPVQLRAKINQQNFKVSQARKRAHRRLSIKP
jgi:rRNA maturation protein Nop10